MSAVAKGALSALVLIALVGGAGYLARGTDANHDGTVEPAEGRVQLIAVAPDGTHLWRYNGFQRVYFASSGTSWQQANTSSADGHTVAVPTAIPIEQ